MVGPDILLDKEKEEEGGSNKVCGGVKSVCVCLVYSIYCSCNSCITAATKECRHTSGSMLAIY